MTGTAQVSVIMTTKAETWSSMSFVRANLFAICRIPHLFFDISNPLTNLVAMLYSIPAISLPVKPFVLRSATVCRI